MTSARHPVGPGRPSRFSEVSALLPRGTGSDEARVFAATVDPNWTIGGKPNGGYLLAILGRAAAAIGPHPHIVAASAYYLRAPAAGPVAVEAHVLRRGRSASQLRAVMKQDEQSCVEATFIAGRLEPSATPYWDGGAPPPGNIGFEECVRLVPGLPSGQRVSIMDQVDVRLEPESLGFARGRPRGRGELRGWLALPGGESFDPPSLLFAVDAFPPGSFDIKFSGWVPTLELTVYVRALPAPGPVQVLQRAELIDGQRVDESCYVWDHTGRLVAQGRQLAGIRLG